MAFQFVAITNGAPTSDDLPQVGPIILRWQEFGSRWDLGLSSVSPTLFIFSSSGVSKTVPISSHLRIWLDLPGPVGSSAAKAACERLLVACSALILNRSPQKFTFPRTSAASAILAHMQGADDKNVGTLDRISFDLPEGGAGRWCLWAKGEVFLSSNFEPIAARKFKETLVGSMGSLHDYLSEGSYFFKSNDGGTWEAADPPTWSEVAANDPQGAVDLQRIRIPLCIGPLSSDVNTRMLARASHQNSRVVTLNYHDLNRTWFYAVRSCDLYVHLEDTAALVSSVYIREPMAAPTTDYSWDGKRFFANLLNYWPGKVLGRSSASWRNASKPLQHVITLHEALKQVPSEERKNLSIPKTFIVKGRRQFRGLPFDRKNLVVKSISGWVTIASGAEDFGEWDQTGLEHLPTLFQERINGPDVRVHVVGGSRFPQIVRKKDRVDYRYAGKRSEFEEFEIPASVGKFCSAITRLERNSLMGIDFLLVDDTYYCLEGNPSPGWSWYVKFGAFDRHSLPQKILDSLKDPHSI